MNKYLAIDIATENGNLPQIINLFSTNGVKPSLLAKQIALINGYTNVVMYIENNIGVRNDIGIGIYKKYNDTQKKFIWSEFVPNKYRY